MTVVHASIRSAMTERVGIDIRKVPTAIRERVDAETRAEDISRNDLVVRILSARYGVPYEPSGYGKPKKDETGTDQWLIRVPRALFVEVQEHAKRVGTQPGVVLLALEQHYGLPPSSPRKRGARRLSPAIVREAQRRHAAGESIRSLAREYRVSRETLKDAMNATRQEVAA